MCKSVRRKCNKTPEIKIIFTKERQNPRKQLVENHIKEQKPATNKTKLD